MRRALIDRAAWQFIKSAAGHRRVTRASITRVCKQTEINETKRCAPVSTHSVSPAHCHVWEKNRSFTENMTKVDAENGD
jgi:hypothetical protein